MSVLSTALSSHALPGSSVVRSGPGWRRGQVTVEAFYTGLFSGDWRYTDLLYKTLSVGLILCPARLNPATINMSFTDWPQKVWTASP